MRKRFTHKVFDTDGCPHLEAFFAEIEKDGWELVAVLPSSSGNYRCFFKRAVMPGYE